MRSDKQRPLVGQDRDGRVTAWQCVGCGKIEAAQNCIGVCEDRKVEFVYASDHDDVVGQLELAREQLQVLRALAQHLVNTTPRAHEWERCYRAMQEQARRALQTVAVQAEAVSS